ncbi:MAG: adenylate/guanylate cyclase domain-containing protein [Hydrogenophaga sp.]|jgi:adenylate cyclase|uniref:CHASE2 domain-containing protein n=1 Tax=Hydrogenophaga sp. TaxID=1904254 RepID=UPI0026155CE3|nr:adenylate/guanylate cyclase domain-containing protein [Hydrogenophaga sp.]MCV0437188.1 adenylate/guanylate cyclase domain-containing protein [Hydrogenophaga sp.]
MKSKLSLRSVAALLSVAMAVLGLTLVLADPLALQTLRHQGFDQYQRWQPRTYEAMPVRIVDIDEASLEKIGQWPWPRNKLAQLVEQLGAKRAAAIGFDVVFAEPDRTSPARVSAEWALSPAQARSLEALPDHDVTFAQAIAAHNVVLGFALRSDAAAQQQPQQAVPKAPYRYVWVGQPSPQALHAFAAAVPPLPVLDAVASGSGALTFMPDGDGVVRRVPMALALAGAPVPGLSAELLRVAQGVDNYILRRAEGDAPALAQVRIGQATVPTNARGEMWLHYTTEQPQRYVPAWKVLAGEADPALLDGHIVLVGSSAQGLMDLRFNPLGRVMPGVEAHAQALEQVLSEHYLTRPSWAGAAEVLAVVLGCVAVVWIGVFVPSLWAAAMSLALVVGVLWGGWSAFLNHRLLLDSFTPALAWAMAFALASLCRHFWSERQQRWVKEAFSRYVSPNRVEYLMNNPGQLELGGKRQHCSFVFTDLAGFTSLMEDIDPAAAVTLLNGYLEEMISIAFRHQGTLDRIVGDALAIMFSAPVVQPDHAQHALDCAMEMHAFATAYARDLQGKGIAFGHTRFGVHSGEVIVGNFGGNALFDYRALGDPVNTAARLESVNKHLGTLICASEATLSACAHVSARPVGHLVLKGKKKALQVFEPLPDTLPQGYAPTAMYQAAYEAARDGEAHAQERFERLRENYPGDPLVALYCARLAENERGDRIVFNAK